MHVKQEKAVLEIIHYFGSVDKMSKATGILRPTIYRYLKGQEITESIARRIEAKSKGKFNYKSLISLKTKYYLELEKFPDSLVEVPINSIIIPKKQRISLIKNSFQYLSNLPALIKITSLFTV